MQTTSEIPESCNVKNNLLATSAWLYIINIPAKRNREVDSQIALALQNELDKTNQQWTLT